MFTLKQLRNSIEKPKAGAAYQTIKKDVDIFLETEVDGAKILVYQNGYITYQRDDRTATFHITVCKDYVYQYADGLRTIISEKEFENCDWTIRVVMEGERRIEKNQKSQMEKNELGYSVGDDNETIRKIEHLDEDVFVDPTPSWEEVQVNRETLQYLEKIVSDLLPRQKELLQKRYLEGMQFKDIAEEWGCKEKTVQKVEKRVRERLQWYMKKFLE